MSLELFPTQPSLALYALLDGGERVGGGSQGSGVDAKVIVLHAIVRGVQPLLDGPVAAQVQGQLGEHLVLVLDMVVEHVGHGAYRLAQVGHVALPQLGDAALGHGLGHILVQCDLEHLGQVDLGAILQAVLPPRQGEPVAARVSAQPRRLHGDAVTGKPGDNVLGTQELGATGLVLELDLDAAAQEPGIGVRPHRDPHVGGDAHLVGCLQNEVGDVVSHIAAGFVGAAELQVGGVAQ